MIWQFFFLYLPLTILLAYSFLTYVKVGRYFAFSFVYYLGVFNFLYFRVILNSFVLASITSIICLFVAYPVAYFLAMKVKRFKTFFLFSLILPSWTSFIVQVYAWFFLLQKKSFLSWLLFKFGIISEASHLLNNYFAILVGTVYCFLPFMILPIYAVLERMDKELLEASADLGANWLQTFRRVIFPLSSKGVMAGVLLVFIPTFGEFAVPDLLGGGKEIFWGSMIVEKFLMSRNWQSGAALTVEGILFLIVFFTLCFAIYKFFNKYVMNKF